MLSTSEVFELINYIPIECWPDLAWCAICSPVKSEVQVLHGPKIETERDWFGEIAWAGKFEDAAFDQTDIVCGSGGRVRGESLVFVGAGSIVERLHRIEVGQDHLVSNSLPCVLSVANTSLDPTYPGYYEDLRSINDGLDGYVRHFRCLEGWVEFVYFDNLVWDGSGICRQPKPHSKTTFADYGEYVAFLDASMRSIADNIRSPARTFPYEMIATVSSGYDSAATAAIASGAGCARLLTIDRSRSRESDSGEEIGNHLGLEVIVVSRDDWRSAELAEVPFIAGGPGGGGSVYIKSGEEVLKNSVLFTGLGGGLIWGEIEKHPEKGYPPIGFSDASLAEYRIATGFLHCPLPLWGMRTPDDIYRITASDEMKPWHVSGNYNRPLPRRIVESAGVPREAFGMKKKAAAFKLHQPSAKQEALSPSSSKSFHDWLRQSRKKWLRRGKLPPSPTVSALVDRAIGTTIVALRVTRKLVPFASGKDYLAVKARKLRHFARRPPGSIRRFTFPWAVDRMVEEYEAGRSFYPADISD